MLKNIRSSTICGALLMTLVSHAALAANATASLDTKTPCEPPSYPRASLVNEEAGTVVLAFMIAADGHVLESKVEKSSGFKNLDKAAINGFSQCKFKPVMKDGKAEQTWANMAFTWKLD